MMVEWSAEFGEAVAACRETAQKIWHRSRQREENEARVGKEQERAAEADDVTQWVLHLQGLEIQETGIPEVVLEPVG